MVLPEVVGHQMGIKAGLLVTAVEPGTGELAPGDVITAVRLGGDRTTRDWFGVDVLQPGGPLVTRSLSSIADLNHILRSWSLHGQQHAESGGRTSTVVGNCSLIVTRKGQQGSVECPRLQLWLGVTKPVLVSGQLARRLHLPPSGGLLIQNIEADSPAAAAGLKGSDNIVQNRNSFETEIPLMAGGDLITAIDGKPVQGQDDLTKALSEKVGTNMELTIFRRGGVQKVPVTLSFEADVRK